MIEQMLREFIERLAAQELNIPDGISLTGILMKIFFEQKYRISSL